MACFEQIIHTADIAYRIKGATPEKLFNCGLQAWRHAITGMDLILFSVSVERKIDLSASDLEMLLVEFLSEINYLITVEKLFAANCDILEISQHHENYHLTAKVNGINISEIAHLDISEIKAVTFHQLNIVEENGILWTNLVFDI